jgi:alkylation response protein AidB-like acyl-CoA dehydrogenase
MPIYRAPVQDALFIIRELLQPQQYGIASFQEALDLVEPLLEEGAKLCEHVLFPLNQSGDKQGCRYEQGNVRMPDGFKEAYKTYCEGGWPSFTAHTEYGGQGLPEFLSMPVTEMVCSANLSFGLTPGLSHGAYNAIYLHGTQELRERFLPHIATGSWSGVMCLTEPQAGTDLGLLTTRAQPHGDGTYGLTGNRPDREYLALGVGAVTRCAEGCKGD